MTPLNNYITMVKIHDSNLPACKDEMQLALLDIAFLKTEPNEYRKT